MNKDTSKKQQLAHSEEKLHQLDEMGDVISITSIKLLRNNRSVQGLRNLQRPEELQRIQEQQILQLRKKMQEKRKRIEKDLSEVDEKYALGFDRQKLAYACYLKAHDKYFQDLKSNHPDKQLSNQQMKRLNIIWQQECEKMSQYHKQRNELSKQLKQTESIIAPPAEYQRPKTESELARDRQIQEAEHELQGMLMASSEAEREYYQFEEKYLGTNDKEQFNKMSATYKEKQRRYYELQEAIKSLRIKLYLQ